MSYFRLFSRVKLKSLLRLPSPTAAQVRGDSCIRAETLVQHRGYSQHPVLEYGRLPTPDTGVVSRPGAEWYQVRKLKYFLESDDQYWFISRSSTSVTVSIQLLTKKHNGTLLTCKARQVKGKYHNRDFFSPNLHPRKYFRNEKYLRHKIQMKFYLLSG